MPNITTHFKRILVAESNESGNLLAAAQVFQGLDASAEVQQFHMSSTRPGEILDDLLKYALEWRADLLVLGARKHQIASRAAMLAPCAILMVPDAKQLSFENVLVPVDFSESSADAMRRAKWIAERAKGNWGALTVESADDSWLDWHEDHAKIRLQLESFVESATGRSAQGRCLVEPLTRSVPAGGRIGGSFAHAIEGSDIASTIVDVALRERASLLVMGTRGRTRSASILLGSVTEHVMQFAPCPVLAVKRAAGQLGLLEAVLERLREPEPVLTAN